MITRHFGGGTVLLLTTLFAPVRAESACAEDLIRSAFTMRVDSESAGELIDGLLSDVDLRAPIPVESIPVNECPLWLEDTVITPTDGDLEIRPVESEVTFREGALDVRVRFDVFADVDMDVQVCALPDTSCSATIDSQALEMHASVAIDVDDCEPTIELQSVDIFFDAASNEVDVEGCGLYDWLGERLFTWYEEDLIEAARVELIENIETEGFDLITDALERVANDGVEALGFALRVAPQTLKVTPESFELDAALGFEGLGPLAQCGDPSLEPPRSPARLPPPRVGDAAVAVSREAIDHVIFTAWRHGWLCLNSRDLGIELGSILEQLDPDAELTVALDVPQPPRLFFEGGNDTLGAGLELPEFRVGVGFELPNAETSSLTATSSATFGAALQMNPSDNSLQLVTRELSSSGFVIESQSGPIVFDPVGLQRTLDRVVLPAVEDSVEDLRLTGSFFLASGVATRVVELAANEDGVGVALEVYRAAEGDTTPPVTQWRGAPKSLVSTNLIVEMDSYDESPPERLLRHRVYRDGVADPELYPGSEFVLRDLPPGEMSFEVAAVDLAGNEDPDPLVLEVRVDAEAPRIAWVSPPRGFVEELPVELEYEVRDDVSPESALLVEYIVNDIPVEDEASRRVVSGELQPGRPLRLSELEEDRAYRVTLSARDPAGNRSEIEIALTVNTEPTLDCASAPTPFWGVVLVIALLRRRRMRPFRVK